MRKLTSITAMIAATGIALTGCATGAQVTDRDPAADAGEGGSSSSFGPALQPDPEAVKEAEAEARADAEAEQLAQQSGLKFGDTATFEDGLALTLDILGESHLGEYGASTCVAGDPVTLVKLTVTNGTTVSYDPSTAYGLEAVYSGEDGLDVQADDVFDTIDGHELAAGLNFPVIRPGKSASDVYGFCTVGMESIGDLLVTADMSSYEEDGYRDLMHWTEDGTGSY